MCSIAWPIPRASLEKAPFESSLRLSSASLPTSIAIAGFGDILRHRWGFRFSQPHAWKKDRLGTGKRGRENGEFILIGVRGGMAAPSPEDMLLYVFEAPRSRPSEKPSIVHEHIERIYPAPLVRIEMFARPKALGTERTGLYVLLPVTSAFRSGWWVWGDEVPGGLMFVP